MSKRLEMFKFSVYVFVPIMAVGYFQDPKVFRAIIEKRQYIRYPAENETRPEDLLYQTKSSTSSSSASSSSTSSSSAPNSNLRPRRYYLFGPRDDPDALKAKRAQG
jgi:hypothetical protein